MVWMSVWVVYVFSVEVSYNRYYGGTYYHSYLLLVSVELQHYNPHTLSQNPTTSIYSQISPHSNPKSITQSLSQNTVLTLLFYLSTPLSTIYTHNSHVKNPSINHILNPQNHTYFYQSQIPIYTTILSIDHIPTYNERGLCSNQSIII